MDEPKEGETVWHIVFGRSNYKHWIFRWIHPDFQHVWCIKESLGKCYWITINGRRSHLEVETYSKDFYPDIDSMLDNGDIVVRSIVGYDMNNQSAQLGIMSCVDVVKRCLGVSDWLCWTPYQLYKNLIGGKYDQKVIKSRRRQSKEGCPPSRAAA